MIDVRAYRKPEHAISEAILSRWSPRAMSGEPIGDNELMPLIEAARWAPSSRNNQPWRFLYAHRGSEHWDTFFDLLSEGNRVWAQNAAVLLLVVSKKTFDQDGKPSPTHSFDTGAAWAYFALQGSMNGLVVHGMGGFNANKARQVLRVPDQYDVEIMIAVGKPGDPERLPENLRERETPSGRRPLSEIAVEGAFRR